MIKNNYKMNIINYYKNNKYYLLNLQHLNKIKKLKLNKFNNYKLLFQKKKLILLN